MATLKEVTDTVLSRIGEDVLEPDEEIIPVIHNGINQAYLIIRSMVDQYSGEYTADYITPLELPGNVGDIINIKHNKDGILAKHEYSKDANLLYIFTPLKKGTLEIKHVILPSRLVQDSDTIELSDLYIPALVAYGAYSYQLYRRKYASAQMLLAEFQGYTGQQSEVATE